MYATRPPQEKCFTHFAMMSMTMQYICMYIYTYVCIYIYTYVCVYIYIVQLLFGSTLKFPTTFSLGLRLTGSQDTVGLLWKGTSSFCFAP